MQLKSKETRREPKFKEVRPHLESLGSNLKDSKVVLSDSKDPSSTFRTS